MQNLVVLESSQRGVSLSRGQGVDMGNGSVCLVKILVSQRGGKQEQRCSEAHDDGKHKVWFRVGMVAEPLVMLVNFHC